MNAERLIAHYERIADAPDAIALLRRFIVDLAVRGKLFPQDLADEPAAQLLKRIAAEKARLVRSGAIRNEKPAPAIEDDLPRLPAGWAWARLSETGRIFNGDSVSESEKAELAKVADGLPFVATKDIGYGRDPISYDNGLKVPRTASGYKKVRAGSVLICSEGGSAGRKIALTDRPICFGNKLYANETWPGINAHFILYQYMSSSFYQAFAKRMTGIIGGIAKSEFQVIPISLPPSAEQTRIVAKVDELMALCDRLESARGEREATRDRLAASSLARLNTPDPETFQEDALFVLNALSALTTRPDQIKHLRRTILNLAVIGKLGPQDANDEPVSTVIARVGLETARLVKIGAIPRPKHCSRDQTKLKHELPPSWARIALGEVCGFVTSGSRGWAEFYSDSGPGFVRAQNIRFGRLKLDDLAFVNPPVRSEGARTQVARGDLLVVITGAGVTNPALLDHDIGEAYVSQHVGLVRPTIGQLSNWLLLCLMAPSGGRAELVERAYGSGKPGLNLDNLRRLSIPLPPLAEQRRVIGKVDQLMALCDRLEASLDSAGVGRGRLLNALLQEALAPAALAEAA